jgi:hypothetical protein
MNPLVGTLLIIAGIYLLLAGLCSVGLLWMALLDRYEYRRDLRRARQATNKFDKTFCEKSGIDWKHTAKPPLKDRA